jgi:hypothetical protein
MTAAATPVGAEGGPPALTLGEAGEGTEVPTWLVAVTFKVYDVPVVSPVTVHVKGPVDHAHV